MPFFIDVLFLLILNLTIPINKKNYLLGMKQACESGKAIHLFKLVKLGGDLSSDNNICAKLAASNGHLNVLKILNSSGADLRVDEDEPLVLASYKMTEPNNKRRKEYEDVVNFLLSNGASFHSQYDLPLRLAQEDPYLMNIFERYNLQDNKIYNDPFYYLKMKEE